MFKKAKTLYLAGFFILLLGIVFWVESNETVNEKGTFQKDFISLEMDKVTALNITTKAKNEVLLKKMEGVWKVKWNNDTYVQADGEKVEQAIEQIAIIKASNLVSTNKDKYNEFQVDTAGVRVKLSDGSKTLVDIILGKFSFKSQREMYTYVRLAEDDKVYSVEGLLDISFNRQPDFWRYDAIVDSDPEDWSKLTYVFPGDSSFILEKKDKKWMMNENLETDSTQLFKTYFSNLKYVSSSSFTENIDKSKLLSPEYLLTIEVEGEESIKVKAFYSQEGDKYIISTSQNPDSHFTLGKNDDAFKRLFPSKASLLPGKVKVTDVQIHEG